MERRTFLAATAAAAALPADALAQGENPVYAKWTGPYGGVAAFDKARVEHFKPAIERAIAENVVEIDAIAKNPAPPNFENTIAALERVGRALDRTGTLYGVFSGTLSTPAFRDVEKELDPKLSAHNDAIVQNAALFARIEAVYATRQTAGLTSEQQRLAWRYWNNFVRAGARLDDKAKARVGEINQRLASLFAKFGHHRQHMLESNPLRNRMLRGTLNDRAISHGIRKRNAKFNHICTGFHQGVHQGHRRCRQRITRSNIGDQRRPLVLGGTRKRCGNAISRCGHVLYSNLSSFLKHHACALCDRVDIFIAASGQIDQNHLVLRQRRGKLCSVGKRM